MVRRATRTLFSVLVAAALGLGLAACNGDDDDVQGPEETVFSAQLSGANEVPPVQTDATGMATFTLSEGTVTYRIEVENLVNVFAAHIHIAAAGENGPIRVGLFDEDPPVTIDDGLLVEGSFTEADVLEDLTFDDLLDLMETGGAYVNVHTSANPGGEIRGQIMLFQQ